MRRSAPVIAALFFALSSQCLGQVTVTRALTLDIPFAFIAGSVTLPAGKYEIQGTSLEGEIRLTNLGTQDSVMAQVLTRISPRDTAEVVFDRTADTSYLSEVYMPGLDGFLIQGAQVRHTHVGVKAKVK